MAVDPNDAVDASLVVQQVTVTSHAIAAAFWTMMMHLAHHAVVVLQNHGLIFS